MRLPRILDEEGGRGFAAARPAPFAGQLPESTGERTWDVSLLSLSTPRGDWPTQGSKPRGRPKPGLLQDTRWHHGRARTFSSSSARTHGGRAPTATASGLSPGSLLHQLQQIPPPFPSPSVPTRGVNTGTAGGSQPLGAAPPATPFPPPLPDPARRPRSSCSGVTVLNDIFLIPLAPSSCWLPPVSIFDNLLLPGLTLEA